METEIVVFDSWQIWKEVLIILGLILFNGVFAMIEIALISARRTRLEQLAQVGSKGAKIALDLGLRPDSFLSSVQVGITLVTLLQGYFSGGILLKALAKGLVSIPHAGEMLIPFANELSLIIVFGTVTYLSIVIGELVPKRLALAAPEKVATFTAPAMNLFTLLCSPLVRFLSFSTGLLLSVFGSKGKQDHSVSEDDVKALILKGSQQGAFGEEEKDMMMRVIRMGDMRVTSAMTPRKDLTWLDSEKSLGINVKTIMNSYYSRYPVCKGTLDNIQGVLLTKEFFGLRVSGDAQTLESCLQKPVVVPESVSVLRMLELFKKSRMHLALVVDEYGAVQGIVTLNNVLEAITGELPEEGARLEKPSFFQRPDGSWLVDGQVSIEELKQKLEMDQLEGEESGDFQTLGGFFMAKLSRIPKEGDTIKSMGWDYEIMDMDGNRVDKILMQRNEK